MKRTATVLALILLAACNRGGEEQTTTSVEEPAITTSAPETTTTTSGETTVAGQPVEEYEVVHQEATADGEKIYVLIAPAEYSDVDLEGFLVRLLDESGPIWEAHVFDARAGVDAGLKVEAERTDADRQALADHYLVALLEGNRVVFQGPMASYGEFILGS